jgi:hypothetical protein
LTWDGDYHRLVGLTSGAIDGGSADAAGDVYLAEYSTPVPSQVRNIHVDHQEGSDSITLTWDAPATDNGSAILDYKVKVSGLCGHGQTIVTTERTATISGYPFCEISITARNSVGFGPSRDVV